MRFVRPEPIMRRLPRRFLLAAPLLAPIGASATGTPAYPLGPVTLVAPFSAGGTADRSARLLAERAPAHLPNRAARILVQNQIGASGAIGTAVVARAAPDGLTLLLARVASSAILPALDPRTPYTWDEFSTLGLLDQSPFVLCVSRNAAWGSLEAVLNALREQPGQLRFATTGPATLLDLGMRELFTLAGLPFDAANAVPFAGAGEAAQALIEQKVELLGSNLGDVLPAIRAGKLRPLLIGSRERFEGLPQVPSALETGLAPLARIVGWNAVFGPAGLPEPVIAAWAQAIAGLRQDAVWQRTIRAEGSVPMLLTPEATRGFLADQVALYRDLGRKLGLV